MQTIFSTPLEIKPGVVRTVQFANGSDRGTATLVVNGKQRAIRGTISGDKFIPDEKYASAVNDYQPQRRRFYKKGRKEINLNVDNTNRLVQESYDRLKENINDFREQYPNARVVVHGEERKFEPNSRSSDVWFRYQNVDYACIFLTAEKMVEVTRARPIAGKANATINLNVGDRFDVSWDAPAPKPVDAPTPKQPENIRKKVLKIFGW